MEQTGVRLEAGRRLVLGFDAGCMTCSELATYLRPLKTRLVEARLPEPGVPALWPVLWMQVCQRQ